MTIEFCVKLHKIGFFLFFVLFQNPKKMNTFITFVIAIISWEKWYIFWQIFRGANTFGRDYMFLLNAL